MLLHLHYNKKKRSTILFTSCWGKYFSVLVHTCSLFLQWNIFWTPWHFASEFLSCLRRCTAPAIKHKSTQFESLSKISNFQFITNQGLSCLPAAWENSHHFVYFQWLLRKMMSEEWTQTFHTDVLSLLSFGYSSGSDWLTIASTKQNNYPDLVSETSSTVADQGRGPGVSKGQKKFFGDCPPRLISGSGWPPTPPHPTPPYLKVWIGHCISMLFQTSFSRDPLVVLQYVGCFLTPACQLLPLNLKLNRDL